MNRKVLADIQELLVKLNRLLPVEGRRHAITLDDDSNLMMTFYVPSDAPERPYEQHYLSLSDADNDYDMSIDQLLNAISKYVQSLQKS